MNTVHIYEQPRRRSSERIKHYWVPTVERTFQILELIAHHGPGLRLAAVSRQLGIAKSTAFNILSTLEGLGYVTRSDGGDYQLTLRLYSISRETIERIDLRRIALPFLRDLVKASGETANLGTIQGDEAVYIESLESPGPFKVDTWPGKRLSLHSTALGKALIAYLPEQEIVQVLNRHGMPAYTPNTATSAEKLLAELAHVRSDGYSIDDEEDVIGLRCVGAPVFDHTGQVIAAISLTAPVQRLTRERLPEIAGLVIGCARRLSERLGYDGADVSGAE